MSHEGRPSAIVWTGRQSLNTGTFEQVLQTSVDGKNVSVAISHEAMTIHGVEACKQIAEQKIIEASSKDGQPPDRVDVTTVDFL